MKTAAILSAFLVLALLPDNFSLADETWDFVSGIKEADLREVTADQSDKNTIYAASPRALYKTRDGGGTWRAVFSAKGDANSINFIGVSGQGVFICTEKGVFRSLDGESRWQRIFKGIGAEENSAAHIAFSKNSTAYLGTKAGLFISSDNGATWKKDPGEAGGADVKWICVLEQAVFLATERGVYKSSDPGWNRVFVTLTEDAEYDSDSRDAAASAVKPVNSILAHKGELFLATDSGVFASEDKGDTWSRFSSDGLLSQKVKRLLFKDSLYAATDKGIFVFDDKDKIWNARYKGMAADEARSMSIDTKRKIWVATNKGLYKAKIDDASCLSDEGQDVLERFSHEPDIREVQEAAIKYAEVHPDKIREWREAARHKALLPRVSVGLDRYVIDYYHWDAGQSPDVLQKGDDVVAWDVSMSWDLGELVWNDDQTSIDTRSRLMVQLRDDILDEITRTYFERRRLQIETYLSPSSDLKQKLESELRIQELTADLDALTGGSFSREAHPQ